MRSRYTVLYKTPCEDYTCMQIGAKQARHLFPLNFLISYHISVYIT